MIDAYFIGYSRAASTSIQLAFHKHPQVQQSMKLRMYVNDQIYLSQLSDFYALYKDDHRLKVESDEEVIGNDLMGDYRLILQRAKQSNPDLKIIIALRSQHTRIPSEYVYEMIVRGKSLSFQQWTQSVRGEVVLRSANYFERMTHIYKLIDKRNVHVVLFEKFISEPELEINRLFDFLGLEKIHEKSFLIQNNASPSQISLLFIELFYRALLLPRNLKKIIFPERHSILQKHFANHTINISSKRKCIDNESIIFKSDFRQRNSPAIKYLYNPLLQRYEPQFKRISKKLNYTYLNQKIKDEIFNTFAESNQQLSELLTTDLSRYGYHN